MKMTQENIENKDGGKITDYVVSSNGNQYLLDGPLARAFSEALDVLYKKEVDPVSGVALETQAIDALHSQMEYKEKMAGELMNKNLASNMGLVFGVEKGKADADDLIDVTDTLSSISPEQKNMSAVVFDAATTNEGSPENPEIGPMAFNPFEKALEQLCAKHGVRTYQSLAQFVKHNL